MKRYAESNIVLNEDNERLKRDMMRLKRDSNMK